MMVKKPSRYRQKRMPMESDSLEKIHKKILSMLTGRDYSRHTLLQKLKAKGFATNDCEQVIDKLIAAGLFNESRFIENYIYYRRQRGYGPDRIAQELRLQGISADRIALGLQITDNAWLDAAHKVWEKRFKGLHPHDFKDRIKQIRFLQYRGFTKEQIDAIVSDKTG